MAFTLTTPEGAKSQPGRQGHQLARIVDLVVSSYTTGGETVTAAQLGMSKILGVRSLGQVNSGGTQGTTAHWIEAAGKIMLTEAGAQVSSTAARTVRIEVVGL